jgi:hypothetical protein
MATQQAVVDMFSPSEEDEQAISEEQEEDSQESDYDNEEDDIETLEDDGAYSNDDDDDALEDIVEMDESNTFQL